MLTRTDRRRVSMADLTPGQRQIVWSGLKIVDPAYAKSLINDSFVATLKNKLGASMTFSIDDFNQYISAANNAIKAKNNKKGKDEQNRFNPANSGSTAKCI